MCNEVQFMLLEKQKVPFSALESMTCSARLLTIVRPFGAHLSKKHFFRTPDAVAFPILGRSLCLGGGGCPTRICPTFFMARGVW
jgi:hypothetical protein